MRFDMDDLYIQAEEELTEELDRVPTDYEIATRAQDLYENICCRAYDDYKASKYDC